MSAVAAVAARAQAVTDTDLVAAVRAGDAEAFEELYRRHRQPVNALVRRIVRDEGRAEDVTQETFLSALRAIRRTDRPIAFRAWICEIARNAAIDAYRRGSRAQEVSIDAEGGLTPADSRRMNTGVALDTTVIHRERFDHLRGALEELSDTHHRIVVMRELEGLSYREIGERMELSPSAVESTLFRARRRLEHEYDQLSTGGRCLAMDSVIARLAEGAGAARDRKRLDRHARRCSNCRRLAREMGVEPVLERRSIAARVAALLPFPLLGRRGASAHAGDLHNSMIGLATTPGADTGIGLLAKGAALVAAIALVGGGGATLGGVGPIAAKEHKPQPPARVTPERTSAPAPASRDASPSGTRAQGRAKGDAKTGQGSRGTGDERTGSSRGSGSEKSATPAVKAPAADPAGAVPTLPSAQPPATPALPLQLPSDANAGAPSEAPSAQDLGLSGVTDAVQGATGALQQLATGN
jgi:RNA polymerase sigma factor (sigma-70 family)